MKTFFDYSKSYYVNHDGKIYTAFGLSYYDDLSVYANYFKTHVIEASEQFRPDRIAYNLWDNQYISWVLDIINNIQHLSDYYIGREIYYLEEDFLRTLGIL